MRWCFGRECLEQVPAAWRTPCLQMGIALHKQARGSVICFGAELPRISLTARMRGGACGV